MNVDAAELDMGDDVFQHHSSHSAASPSASLAVQAWIDDASHDHAHAPYQALPLDLLPETTPINNELTSLSAAEKSAKQNQTPPATPRFDPKALLNPKAATKRPASAEEGGESSNAGLAAGQVSLVERLHNVQERAASPAKRVKTAEEQRKKKNESGASFGRGSALDLGQNGGASLDQNGGPPLPPAQVDLTMSTSASLLALSPADPPRRR